MNSIDTLSQPDVENEIRVQICPKCFLCGSEGQFIYKEQRDRLFQAAGTWNLKKCSRPGCGLIWLDPMPVSEDIGKAYLHYYTHASKENGTRPGMLKRIYRQMRRGYWSGKYNYQTPSDSFVSRSIGKLLYLFPLRRREADADVRFLQAYPQGRLLDVGCGSGEWLLSMQELGWQVEGVDFDENAVSVARKRGVEVRCGSVEQQRYPDQSFDAVTMHHVIEHVPDPMATLKECARLLKPGGKLVVFTPNGSSLSHGIFKWDWRGLEPPRHLHIFSLDSMSTLLEKAGFRQITIVPQIARSVISESILLWLGETDFTTVRRIWSVSLLARWFNFIELGLIHVKPSAADCMAAIAVKH